MIHVIGFCLLFLFMNFRILTDNLMVRIKADGLFRDLPNLVKADLRRNKIAVIDNGAFEGANTLLELYVFPSAIPVAGSF